MAKAPKAPPAGMHTLWSAVRTGAGDDDDVVPRREPLSALAIVRTGVQLADEHGLAHASMSRIADQLGFTAMALYRHVANKDQLLSLMVDMALDFQHPAQRPVGEPDGAADWRADVESWAHDLLSVFTTHIWLGDVPFMRLDMGPRRMAWFDRGLRALHPSGLGIALRSAFALQLNDFVLSHARLRAHQLRASAEAQERVQDGDVGEHPLAGIVDDVREAFPDAYEAIEAGVFAAEPTPESFAPLFELGLSVLLDGIAQHAAREE